MQKFPGVFQQSSPEWLEIFPILLFLGVLILLLFSLFDLMLLLSSKAQRQQAIDTHGRGRPCCYQNCSFCRFLRAGELCTVTLQLRCDNSFVPFYDEILKGIPRLIKQNHRRQFPRGFLSQHFPLRRIFDGFICRHQNSFPSRKGIE